MTQERIDRFMSEYKRLCTDFGMSFQDPEDNGLNLRDDVADEVVSYNADLESLTATLYVPAPRIQGPLTETDHRLREMSKANHEWYAKSLLERLSRPVLRDMMSGSKEVPVLWRRVEHK